MVDILTRPQAVQLLTNLPKSVKLELTQTPAGIRLTEQRTKQQILDEKYGNLIGQPITLTEAAYLTGTSTNAAGRNSAKPIRPRVRGSRVMS